MRRQFKAWEICALHMDEFKASVDPLSVVWAICKDVERDKFKRQMLYSDVLCSLREFWGYDILKL